MGVPNQCTLPVFNFGETGVYIFMLRLDNSFRTDIHDCVMLWEVICTHMQSVVRADY